uniref:Uncharacterized protein n=1 Tax=Cyprinus carpio TaxID=7962 RepID=A0A8C1XSL1_CYPCA
MLTKTIKKNQVQVQVTLSAFSYLPPFLIIHGNSLSVNSCHYRWLKKLDGPSTLGPDTSQENSGPPEKIRITDTKTRQYQDNYKMFGFTATTTEPTQPLCFLCGEVLSNYAMKPSHLQQHLRTKHSSCVGRSAEFFHRKYSEIQKSQGKLKAATQMSSSSLLASYEVSLVVAKSIKPYSIAEKLIVPAAAILAETMLDKKAAKAIKTVPLSNDTVCRRIDDMMSQLILVAYHNWLHLFAKDMDNISEHILFCKPMLGKTTGEDIFNVVDSFSRNTRWTGRCAHTYARKAEALHPQLRLHTDVRWLSRGKTLQRLFELREQVGDFLSEHLHPLSALLKDFNWLAHLAYLAEFFLAADTVSTLQTVQTHMSKLSSEFKSYFPNIEVQNSELHWIRNPFVATSIETAPVSLQERLIDLSSDTGLKIMFSETPLTKFWCSVEKEYPDVGKCALYELLPFGSTYLSEVTFSAMANIKTKQRTDSTWREVLLLLLPQFTLECKILFVINKFNVIVFDDCVILMQMKTKKNLF